MCIGIYQSLHIKQCCLRFVYNRCVLLAFTEEDSVRKCVVLFRLRTVSVEPKPQEENFHENSQHERQKSNLFF